MPSKWKFPPGPSSLRNVLLSYEEPSPETQTLTSAPPLPGALVFEKIIPRETVNVALKNHDLAQLHFEHLRKKDSVSSNTVDIRKDSDFIPNLSDTRQEIKPNSIATSENERSYLIDSRMATSNLELPLSKETSKHSFPSCSNCAPKADVLGSFNHNLRELEDFLALDAPLPMKSNLSQQSSIQNLESFSKDDQKSETSVSHGDFEESNDRILDGKASSRNLVGHDAGESSSRSSSDGEIEPHAMQREDLDDQSTNHLPQFLSPRHYDYIVSSSVPLLCKDTTTQNDQSSSGYLTRRPKPSIRKSTPKYVNTSFGEISNLAIPRYGKRGNILPNQPPCPAKYGQKPHEYELRLAAYFRGLESPLIMTENGKSICKYRHRPPRIPAKSRKTVFHRGPTPNKRFEIDLKKCLSKSSLKSWRVRKSRVKSNRKSNAELSGNGFFGYQYRKIKIMQLSRAKLATFTNNKFNANSVFQFLPSSVSDIKVDFDNYSHIDWGAENDDCSKNKFTSSRAATNEPLVDRAKGITDADRPDSFKRLFSTIRVQNESPEQSEARKRRRREIIQDNISDYDLAGMGEPRKIIRLHRKELMNKFFPGEPRKIIHSHGKELMEMFNSGESITEERVRELMLIGRFTGYAGILETETTECETTNRVSFKDDEINSDEMEIDEPRHNSWTTNSKEKSTDVPVRPGLIRRQPMDFSKGVVDMVRSGAETKKGAMEILSRDLSIPDLRRLQKRVCEIREFITSTHSISGGVASSISREMKKQLQKIRDEAVCAMPPATHDDRQRAARIIRAIDAENRVQNKSGNNSSISFWAWYYHNDYDVDNEILIIDMEIDELESEIRLIPKGDKRRNLKRTRLRHLESQRDMLEEKDTFYEDSSCDDLEFIEADFWGKAEPDAPSKNFDKLSDTYRNAIASWGPVPKDAVDEDEDPDVLRAINLSLEEGEFVEAMNEGIDHAVPTPSHKTWEDGVESEQEQIEHAIEVSIDKEINTRAQCLQSELLTPAIPFEKFPGELVDEHANIQRAIKLSFNQRQHFEPKKQGTGRTEAPSSPENWQGNGDSEEEQLKRAIAMSLATARGEDLEDEDYCIG